MRAAKEAPGFRFYSLCDKVWRLDVLRVAWQEVRRNGGSAGVDGEAIADIESSGVDGWLGELARDLKEGTYRPNAVRQVLIPKKQRGKFRPLGIPCVPGDRGGADGGNVGVVADLRSRSGPGTICLSAGPERRAMPSSTCTDC